ncbi:DUF7563 family protein [Haloplanus salinus]
MPTRTHRGAHVSRRFVTVSGDGRGDVQARPDCTARDRIGEEMHARAESD